MKLHQSRPAGYAWLCAGVAAVVLAWTGFLDSISSAAVNASLLDAGVIYGTARGINALVSVLQGTELDMWLVTFSIGELLDPVNDVIERFSAVMTFAVTSLVIQQLLLAIVSDQTFTIALTSLGVATLAAFLIGRPWSAGVLARTFLVLAFVRFSLAIVVVANLWVDRVFLPDSNSDEHAVMLDFYSDLDSVSDKLTGEGKRSDVAGQFERLQDKFDAFVEGTLTLLGAMLMKSVIVPLLFFYALWSLGRAIFRKLSQ